MGSLGLGFRLSQQRRLRAQAIANSLAGLGEELLAKAEAFEAVDQQAQAGFAHITADLREWWEQTNITQAPFALMAAR